MTTEDPEELLEPEKPNQVIPSWSGSGYIEVHGKRPERSTWFDVVLAVVLCLALDLCAFGLSTLLFQRNELTVCGVGCYDNPRVHIHDDVVTLTAAGIVVLGLVALSLVTRRSRVPVIVVQATLAILVAVHTVPGLRTALHRQDALTKCAYGYRPPCVGLADLSPG